MFEKKATQHLTREGGPLLSARPRLLQPSKHDLANHKSHIWHQYHHGRIWAVDKCAECVQRWSAIGGVNKEIRNQKCHSLGGIGWAFSSPSQWGWSRMQVRLF